MKDCLRWLGPRERRFWERYFAHHSNNNNNRKGAFSGKGRLAFSQKRRRMKGSRKKKSCVKSAAPSFLVKICTCTARWRFGTVWLSVWWYAEQFSIQSNLWRLLVLWRYEEAVNISLIYVCSSVVPESFFNLVAGVLLSKRVYICWLGSHDNLAHAKWVAKCSGWVGQKVGHGWKKVENHWCSHFHLASLLSSPHKTFLKTTTSLSLQRYV